MGLCMKIPSVPKIYHIVHVDRLESIKKDGYLWCDREIINKQYNGTTIGMSNIKQRRLNDLPFLEYPDLHVGDCVPFYFCPRSVMLYLIYQQNHPDLSYLGGQKPIIHLEADLNRTVNWCKENEKRWVFTLSNAGSKYFEYRFDLDELSDIDWKAVNARDWRECKEGKQAEFLVEYQFPWHLIDKIGVSSNDIYEKVVSILDGKNHQPYVTIMRDWYY